MVQTPPIPLPSQLPVPVTIRIGEAELPLGHLLVDVTLPRQDVAPAQLANLLRAAAEVCTGDRHAWPRQRWHVGDKVRLPGAIARGTVTQVDVTAKTYLVDLGAPGIARVSWYDVDQPNAVCLLDVDAVTGAAEIEAAVQRST